MSDFDDFFDDIDEEDFEAWKTGFTLEYGGGMFPENSEKVLKMAYRKKLPRSVLCTLFKQMFSFGKETPSEIEKQKTKKEPKDLRLIGVLAEKLKNDAENFEEKSIVVEALASLVGEENSIEKLVQCSLIENILDLVGKEQHVSENALFLLDAIATSQAGLRDAAFRQEALPFLFSFLKTKLEEKDGSEVRLVEMVLAVLRNSSKYYDTAELVLSEDSGFLPVLLRCLGETRGKIGQFACSVVCHCSAHSRFRKTIVASGAIESLLEYSLTVINSEEDELSPERVQGVVRCLANLCSDCAEARMKFKDSRGMALVGFMEETFGIREDQEMLDECLTLLRAVLSHGINSEQWQEELLKWSGHKSTKKVDEVSHLLNEAIIARWQGGTKKVFFDERIEQLFQVPVDEKEDKLIGTEKPLEIRPEVEELLRRISVPPNKGRFYVRNEEWKPLPEDADAWIELSEWTDLAKLKSLHIQKMVCAALNSRIKLSLYFGIAKKKVKGILMEQESRDEFRVGIDCAMTRGFRPIVDPNFYSVDFVPVFVRTGSESMQRVPNCYVVELKIKHIATQLYQLMDGKVFVRMGQEVRSVNFQEARNYFGSELEKNYLKQMEEMNANVLSLETKKFTPRDSGDHC